MDCSMPGFPVLCHLLEFAQTGPLSWWCHPAISSCVVPFSSCLQSFPASGSFPMSWLSISSSRSIGASASVLPMNISFRINWFDLLAAQGTLKSLLQHHNSKAPILQRSAFFMVQLSHPYMTVGKKHSFDYMDLCWRSDATQPFSLSPFSSCSQSFPASGYFPVSWLFTLGGRSIGASASVLPIPIQDWFLLGLTGLVSLLSKGLPRVFSNTTIQKH